MGSISLRGLEKSYTSKMARLLIVITALVACCWGVQGCGQMNEEPCPMPQIDTAEFLQQQMQNQMYETQQMAEKVKAQFQAMVYEATMKKYRYVMSLVTEYISFCQCADSSTRTYNTVFVDSARRLNMTDYIEVWDSSRMPYEARNEEEARALVFGGLVDTMCRTGGAFLTFSEQVYALVPQYVAANAAGKKK